jgi:hypothetical protein
MVILNRVTVDNNIPSFRKALGAPFGTLNGCEYPFNACCLRHSSFIRNRTINSSTVLSLPSWYPIVFVGGDLCHYMTRVFRLYKQYLAIRLNTLKYALLERIDFD